MTFLKKIILLLFFVPIYVFSLNYDVKFVGLKDVETLNAIKRVSNLVILQKRAPKTINALRFRANSDKEQMLKILEFFGFYDAKINLDLEEKNDIIQVTIFISPGPRYTLKEVNIFSDCSEKKELDVCDITLKSLDLKINSPLITQDILNAQDKLIFLLSGCGYPLAKVEKREVKIDLGHKNAKAEWCLDTGPFCKFGALKINGLTNIDRSFVDKKIRWNLGDTYDVTKVVETQQNLLKTNLFTSVAIIHSDAINEMSELGINLKVVEALHKYITAGISYATIDGFGMSFGWANRNFRSLGEMLAIDANVAQRLLLGVATYKKPDFLKVDQDYVLRLEGTREKIPSVYLDFNYSMISRIDTRFSKKIETSIGFKMEYDEITQSGNNGNFFLLSLPFYLKNSTANNLLNPTKGYTIIYRAIPYKNVINSAKYFLKQKLTYNLYIPIGSNRTLVLASRLQLGSVMGANVFDVPMSKLFLGGSDDDLRGYKYRTVSPLNSENEPIGGRSTIYYTFEPRFRMTQKIGFVPFLDLGVVSLKEYPQVNQKWFKSVGAGLRYFSFFGPIRIDVGVPLDRRKGIDSRYKIYVNIGQTF